MKRILIGLMLFSCATPALAQTSLLPTLQQIRPEYPTPMSPAQLGEYLNRVAWAHRAEGWGLLRKTAGNRCPAPQGVEVACDILVYAPTAWHFDVIIDAGGASTPAWTDKGPCDPSISGCDMARFLAPIGPSPGTDSGTDFDGDLHPDLLWQNDAGRQASVWYMDGAIGSQGNTMRAWNWISSSMPGWRIAGTGDFNGDGKLDLVWVNDMTRNVSLWFMGGAQGNVMQSWVSLTGYAGWHIVAIADFNGDGKPDIVAQEDATHKVTVVYMGGAQGTTVLGRSWLSAGGIPGWSVVAARDFDGDGKPDLVWQNDTTRQVSVWYMTGAQGDVLSRWNWISTGGVPGWSVVGARDFNGDGKPDLVWQEDAWPRRVSVWHMTGTEGNVFGSWAFLSSVGVPGWSVIVK